MLATLLRRLQGASADTGPLAPEDARIAIAALLVQAAHADHDYQDAERRMIERVLAVRYALSAAEAAALRIEGEAAEAAALDMFRFTNLIKQAIPIEERAPVLEALWRVILSDGEREAHEDTMMRRVTDLLGLSPRESVIARQRVQGEGAAG